MAKIESHSPSEAEDGKAEPTAHCGLSRVVGDKLAAERPAPEAQEGVVKTLRGDGGMDTAYGQPASESCKADVSLQIRKDIHVNHLAMSMNNFLQTSAKSLKAVNSQSLPVHIHWWDAAQKSEMGPSRLCPRSVYFVCLRQ